MEATSCWMFESICWKRGCDRSDASSGSIAVVRPSRQPAA